MKSSYLEVTFRRGRPLAAYLYLPRASGDKSDHVEQAGAGLLVDYTADGTPIGIEIIAPAQVGIAELNRVLAWLVALQEADLLRARESKAAGGAS